MRINRVSTVESRAADGPRKPLNVRVSYWTSENRKQIAVAIAAMWKKLGVNVELVNTELRTPRTITES